MTSRVVYVEFDLPFTIPIRDSMDDGILRGWAEAIRSWDASGREDPEPSAVPYSPRVRQGGGFNLGGSLYHLPSPESLAEPFEVPLPEGRVRLATLRRVRNVDRCMIANGVVAPDRGNTSFTSIWVEFCAPNFEMADLDAQEGLRFYSSAAVDATNKTLQAFRHVTSAYWLQPIGLSDGTEYRIYVADETGVVTGPRVDMAPPSALAMGPAAYVSDELHGQLRQRVLADAEPMGTLEIYVSAKEHRSRGRFRNAIVDAAAAFEFHLFDTVRAGLARAGMSSGDIDTVFKRPDGRFLGVQEVAKDVLRERLNVNFAGLAEYAQWKRYVADVRNDVLHGIIRTPTAQHADKAISSSSTAARRLSDLIPLDDSE